MVASLLLVVFLVSLAIAAERLTSEVPLKEGDRLQLLKGISCEKVGAFFVGALAVGLVNYAIKVGWATSLLDGWLSIPCLLIMIAVHATIIYWWLRDGYRLRQLLPFAAMFSVVYFTTKASAAAVAALAKAEWSQKAIFALPDLLATAEFILLIGTLLYFGIKRANENERR